jgi:hypothetical protein
MRIFGSRSVRFFTARCAPACGLLILPSARRQRSGGRLGTYRRKFGK